MKLFKIFILVFSVVSLIACGGAEERKAVYLEKAKASIEAGNLDKARIELKNVLQIDPKDAEAYYQLGRVFEQKKEYKKAYGNYLKTEELNPDYLINQASLGKFYLLMNDFDRAQEKIDFILKKEPDNIEGLLLKAAMLAIKKNKQEAIDIAEKVIARAPGHIEGVIFLAALYMGENRVTEASNVLEKALEIINNNERLNSFLALVFIKNKDFDRAEAIYKKFLEDNPGSRAGYNNLAVFYNQLDNKIKAEEILRASIDSEPGDVSRQLALVEYVRVTKDNDEAIKEIKKLIGKNNSLGELRILLAELLYMNGDKQAAIDVYNRAIVDFSKEVIDVESRIALALIYMKDKEYIQANKVLEEAIKISPNDPKVNLLIGKLALINKDSEKAIISLRVVVKETPENIDAFFFLANAYQLENNKEQVRSILNSAYENNKGNPDALLKLAALHLERNDLDQSEKIINDYNNLVKSDYKGLSIKASILNKRNFLSDAKQLAEKLIELYPERPNGYLQMVPYYRQKNDILGAISVLEKGYLNSKNNRKILILLSAIQVNEKKFDLAEKRIKAELNAEPDDVELKILLSKVYAASNNTSSAEALLNEVLESRPDLEEPYLLLFQIYRNASSSSSEESIPVQHENKKKLISILEKGYKNVKNNRKLLALLTTLQVLEKEYEPAEKRIRAALNVVPDDSELKILLSKVYMASNNINSAEHLLSEIIETQPDMEEPYLLLSDVYKYKNDLISAKNILEKGKVNIVSSLQIPLRLALMYELDKDYQSAIDAYRQLYESNPDNLIIVNNLVSMLSDHGDDKDDLDAAKSLIVKLKNSKQPALLDTVGWLYYKLGDYKKSIEYLTQVVEKSHNVNVFNYHLGMAYKMSGDKVLAKFYLEKSLADKKQFKDKDIAAEALKGI